MCAHTCASCVRVHACVCFPCMCVCMHMCFLVCMSACACLCVHVLHACASHVHCVCVHCVRVLPLCTRACKHAHMCFLCVRVHMCTRRHACILHVRVRVRGRASPRVAPALGGRPPGSLTWNDGNRKPCGLVAPSPAMGRRATRGCWGAAAEKGERRVCPWPPSRPRLLTGPAPPLEGLDGGASWRAPCFPPEPLFTWCAWPSSGVCRTGNVRQKAIPTSGGPGWKQRDSVGCHSTRDLRLGCLGLRLSVERGQPGFPYAHGAWGPGLPAQQWAGSASVLPCWR